MIRAESASYAPGISTRRWPAMIDLNFFRTFISCSSSGSQAQRPAVRRRLQPWLFNRHSLFPAGVLVRMLEGEPDVIEPFDQPRLVGGRDLECDVATVRARDALDGQIDCERSGTVHR